MALAPNSPAPDFTLLSKTAEGLKPVTLSSLRGSVVVLLFFPAAFTGVCTDEFCSLSGGLNAIEGAEVFGVSCDTAFAQAAWAEQNKITVPLLSDYQHSVTAAYDVVLPDLAGHGPACKRAAFVIDASGVIVYSEETPTPGDLPNFEAVKAAVQAAR